MPAPAVTGAGAGLAAGASFGPVGAAVGAVIGFVAGVFVNNDNGVIASRDHIVKKFRANTAGAKDSGKKGFPILKRNGGTLFSKYKLEHSQIKDRKVTGNYEKEWKNVAKFGAELLWLMYGSQQLIDMYADLLKAKSKPDHAFRDVVDYAGPSNRTTEQLRFDSGLSEDVVQNTEVAGAPPSDLSAPELVVAGGKAGNVPTGGGCAGVVLLFLVLNALIFTLWGIL